MSITDLHLCKNSPASNLSNSDCECPPEYYCADICGEDYSISTYISWQHFPRSTSSPSRCNDSSETIRKTISDTPVSIKTPEKEESLQLSTTKYPIDKSFAQLNAQHYLEIRHVFKLLNFMIGHLVCNEPEDPVQFLEDLLNQCLKFRDSFGEPPLLFTNTHVKSLYNAFDPFERGYLTPEQYREALLTLGLKDGITKYNEEPPLNDDGNVEDKFFMFEAYRCHNDLPGIRKNRVRIQFTGMWSLITDLSFFSERCLTEDLKQMLRIPLLAEENRLTWEANMAEIKMIEANKEPILKILNDKKNALEGSPSQYCNCYGSKMNTNLICKCPRPTSLRSEPEQLFYDNKTSKN